MKIALTDKLDEYLRSRETPTDFIVLHILEILWSSQVPILKNGKRGEYPKSRKMRSGEIWKELSLWIINKKDLLKSKNKRRQKHLISRKEFQNILNELTGLGILHAEPIRSQRRRAKRERQKNKALGKDERKGPFLYSLVEPVGRITVLNKSIDDAFRRLKRDTAIEYIKTTEDSFIHGDIELFCEKADKDRFLKSKRAWYGLKLMNEGLRILQDVYTENREPIEYEDEKEPYFSIYASTHITEIPRSPINDCIRWSDEKSFDSICGPTLMQIQKLEQQFTIEDAGNVSYSPLLIMKLKKTNSKRV